MSDEEYREIQLSFKQLIFFFMSAVVLAVVIFLLGVSVGRGVPPAPGTVEAAPIATENAVSGGADAPPQPSELTYHRDLQGQKPLPPDPAAGQTPAGSAPAGPPPSPDPAGGAAPAPRNPSTGEVPPISPTLTRQTPAAAAEPPAQPTPPAGTGFDVQVGAFNSKPNADTLVADLKAKGYAAFITPGVRPQPAFLVRVGPYATRAEADRAVAELSKVSGRSKPSVIVR